MTLMNFFIKKTFLNTFCTVQLVCQDVPSVPPRDRKIKHLLLYSTLKSYLETECVNQNLYFTKSSLDCFVMKLLKYVIINFKILIFKRNSDKIFVHNNLRDRFLNSSI